MYYKEKTIKDYCVGDTIYSENYINIFKAYDKENKKFVALKQINKKKFINDESFINECKMFLKFKSEYIIKLYDYFIDRKYYYISLELCDTNLLNFLDEIKSYNIYKIEIIKKIMNQLNKFLIEMVENKFEHRNINPENILIILNDSNKENNYSNIHIKVTNFKINNEQIISTNLNEKYLIYMAPELLDIQIKKDKNIENKSDLWSIGILLYFMCFRKVTMNDYKNYFLNDELPNEIEDKNLKDLIYKLIKTNPNERIGWESYFLHSFFSSDHLDNSLIENLYKNKNLILPKEYKNFNSDPNNLNLIYDINESHCSNRDNQFIVFKSNFNKNYLIYINKDKVSLTCFDLETKNTKEYKNIHLKTILSLRYYTKDKKDLIITSSNDNSVKIYHFNIYNMMCVCEIKNIIETKSENENFPINSVLFVFYNNNDYIIISNMEENYLKIYDMKGNLIKNNFCKHFDDGRTFYIQYFYNYKNKKHFIIKLNTYPSYSIRSYNFEDGIEYKTYSKVSALNCIIQEINNIINIIFSDFWNGIIYFFEFDSGELLKEITLENQPNLNCLLLWNYNYIISGGYEKNIYIIDINKKKETNVFKNKQCEWICTIDKISFNKKEYLITQDLDGIISIWN